MAKQRERATQPSDINQTSAPVARKSKPVRRSEEGLRARKESDRLRVKTRINISYSFTRWRKLKEEKNLRTDGDVANYLLNFSSSSVSMPGMCSVPGCKGYKKARSRGVVFHSLPTRDPERCRKWLKAIQSPKFDENTPVSKYGNIRVCSQHFKPEDYEPDIQAELMKTTPRKILKSNVIPTVFSGRQQQDLSTPLPEDDSSRTDGPNTNDQSTNVNTASPPSLPIPISPSSQRRRPPAELSDSLCIHQQTESTSSTESKTIVNDSCLMELFKKCQTCGRPITQKKVSHCGAQKKVSWSCLGGHTGVWTSSPRLWEAFPEIHLLTTLSILFSGGTFTHFKKWAKHLQLNFMGHKTFFEIQKAYLNPERSRVEPDGVQRRTGGSLLHRSDPLKKIKAKSRRREKRARSSRSSYEKRSSILMTSTGTCMHEPPALSCLGHVSASERGNQRQQDDAEYQSETTHMASEVDGLQDSFEEMEVTIDDDDCSVKNRLSDLDSDVENAAETAELSAPGADDSWDEDAYVPIIPQRSKASELLLECEEEELAPWQQHTLRVHVKEEEDVGELSDDQADCKPDPSSLQSWSVAQLTVTPEVCGVVHKSVEHQISSDLVSSSSVQSPAVCAASPEQLQSDQSHSQTLSVTFPLQCVTVIKLEPTSTSNQE